MTANKHLKSLQIMRAVAATTVVYFHLGAAPKFGGFGVDIFFVLSGFVMALIIESGELMPAFAINRLSRIVPLYWVFTLFTFIAVAWRPELFNSTTANPLNLLKSMLFVPYFKENGELHPMLHVGWSLNYEMFFYLCLAFAITAARRYYALIVGAMILIANQVLTRLPISAELEAFFGNDIIFEFLFGIGAYYVFQTGVLKRFPVSVLWLIAVSAFVFTAYRENAGLAKLRSVDFGIPAFFLVLSAAGLERSLAASRQTQKLIQVLVAAGDASYATYLSHIYVVEFFRKIVFKRLGREETNSLIDTGIVMLSALVVGQALYLILDKPLSRETRAWLYQRWQGKRTVVKKS